VIDTVPLTAVSLPAVACAAARRAPSRKITASIIAARAINIRSALRFFTRFFFSPRQHYQPLIPASNFAQPCGLVFSSSPL
jgi:hypothetical protein